MLFCEPTFSQGVVLYSVMFTVWNFNGRFLSKRVQYCNELLKQLTLDEGTMKCCVTDFLSIACSKVFFFKLHVLVITKSLCKDSFQ